MLGTEMIALLSLLLGQILIFIIDQRQLNPNMRNTHLQQHESNQLSQLFDSQRLQDLKNEKLDYFFQSQSPFQLDYIFHNDAPLQIKDYESEFNFIQPKMSEPTYMTFDKTMRSLNEENESLQKRSQQFTVKSFIDCTNNQINRKNSPADFTTKTMSSEQFRQFSEVFQEVRIKGKYHKNTNVPKILVRIYLKYYSRLMLKNKSQLLKQHMQIKDNLRNRETNNHNISDLLELLNAGISEIPEAGACNREAMSKIILSTLRDQIILNNFVKNNKMSYMIALKIYALRCRSAALTQRVKIM